MRRVQVPEWTTALLALTLAPTLLGCGAESALPERSAIAWVWADQDGAGLPPDVDIAYLAATVTIGERVGWTPRTTPLASARRGPEIAVVRVEARADADSELAEARLAAVVDFILRVASDMAPDEIQIDFDAPTSWRPFYTDLLASLRAELDPAVELSMTALASWCLDDRWIADLPVRYAVPMWFRLGDDADRTWERVADHGVEEPLCRGAWGVATDELHALGAHAPDRIFIFRPGEWASVGWTDLWGKL